MMIYFISGVIAGVSASSYLIGKELFAYYKKKYASRKTIDEVTQVESSVVNQKCIIK
jgi:hypothetical protein